MWFGEAQQFPETGSRTKQDHVPNRITYQTGSRTKQDHVPNSERRDNKVMKGDRAELPSHFSSAALDLL